MNKESLDFKLAILGVPVNQARLLKTHVDQATRFIYATDPGIEAGMAWLHTALFSALDEKDAQLLYGIALDNKPSPEVAYLEEGYDSCQSHRKIAKVIGEAIFLGGLVYEATLLGIPMNITDAQQTVGSTLTMKGAEQLPNIAKKYGSKQDFIFPGVTPSSETTPSLEVLAYLALRGTPSTTVRTLTGVGGLRYDKDWNCAADLATFVDLKIAEDKRYYSGIGIFYFLMKYDLDALPAVVAIRQSQPDLYAELAKFASTLKKTRELKFSGVSILCSVYLPTWSEMKAMQGYLADYYLELAEAFHSPSYEFAVLRSIFEQWEKGEKVAKSTYAYLATLTKKLDYCWTFNSTLHLPWTAELAGLSNDFFGKITNQAGDYCTRYGVGLKGKSFEIREHVFGLKRQFPAGLNGKRAYEARLYPQNDHFVGSHQSFMLNPDDPLVATINNYGLMRAALSFLEGISNG